MDKVSIIIPVYNGDKYLIRCIDSLLNQTYTNNEYIFINDGSSDNTLSILKDYAKKDNRIKIIDKKNTGVSDSRNKGIEKAEGNYICFCDADDQYEKKYIETMLNLIKTNDVDVVKCNFKVINKSGQTIDNGNNFFINQTLNHQQIINEIIPKCLSGEIPCFTYLLMIKNDKLSVKFPTDIAMMEDVMFYINLLLSIDNMYITSDELYTIMFNDNGATNNIQNYKRNINNIVLVNKYIKNILQKNNLLTSDNILKVNSNHLNAIADFIFKHYLYANKTINLCKEVRTSSLVSLIKDSDLSQINIARRLILKMLKNEHYLLLKIYFVIREKIYHFKRVRNKPEMEE